MSFGISISIKQVVVNPASTAACVAMALKLAAYKLSSFSLSLIALCFRLISRRLLSAASISAEVMEGGSPRVRLPRVHFIDSGRELFFLN